MSAEDRRQRPRLATAQMRFQFPAKGELALPGSSRRADRGCTRLQALSPNCVLRACELCSQNRFLRVQVKVKLVRFAVVLSLVLVFAASGAAPALAGRNLVVGVNDDAVKWRPGISSISNDLGLGYYRVTEG